MLHVMASFLWTNFDILTQRNFTTSYNIKTSINCFGISVEFEDGRNLALSGTYLGESIYTCGPKILRIYHSQQLIAQMCLEKLIKVPQMGE